jgi:hypothetical protein
MSVTAQQETSSMNDDKKEGFKGSCLCGSVKFESRADPQFAFHCSCKDCRKSSGTGHCTHVGVPTEEFTVTGEVRFFECPADSGHLISRGFCGTCGSPVYSRNSRMPHMVFPRASVLDDPEIVAPSMVVYTSRAPSWNVFHTDIPAHDEMPEH